MFYRSQLTDRFLQLSVAALLVYTNQDGLKLIWKGFEYSQDSYVKSVRYTKTKYDYPYLFGIDPALSYWLAIASGGAAAVIIFKFLSK